MQGKKPPVVTVIAALALGFVLLVMAAPVWAAKFRVLHRFAGKDGAVPAASLIFDTAGNLYGTTQAGGGWIYYGTVFELAPSPKGKWTEHVLHSFNGSDGAGGGSLAIGATGDLYGTTFEGLGVVFKLALDPKGKWRETVLRRFSARDGSPDSVILDGAGNLYGTATGSHRYHPGGL